LTSEVFDTLYLIPKKTGDKVAKQIELNMDTVKKLFGTLDCNVRLIERHYGVSVRAVGGKLEVHGEEEAANATHALIEKLLALIAAGEEIDAAKIRQTIDILNSPTPDDVMEIARDIVTVTAKGKQIKCKTQGQKSYVKAIKQSTVIFGIGPAGTGKTYLAVALAYAALRAGEVQRIILTRPVLEAGEKLGFLPGDLTEKIAPYLRPLYDALGEMFGSENYLRLMERGDIEVAPLAYMRGRTLSSAFVILDEAQNTTGEQMKMFLTRLGAGSKMVVTGDQTQADLPRGSINGLKQAAALLKDIDDISVCYLSDKDIVRHELVQRIVRAYGE